MQQLETRYVSLFNAEAAEVRNGEAEQPNRIVGLIPYNSLSVDLGGFRERITPLAFRSTLTGGGDVLALVDHSREKVLGRTANQTLRLTDTPKGLELTIDLPATSYANDFRELAKRGDAGGISFGFKVRQNGQKFTREDGLTIRELVDIDLREVSVISSNPAYRDTTLALRSAAIDPTVSAEISAPRNASAWAVFRRALSEG